MHKYIAPKDRPGGIPTTKVTNEINDHLRSLNPVAQTGQEDEFWGGGGTDMLYGKALAAWVPGENYIMVDPCDIDGVDNGEASHRIDLSSPNNGAAPTTASIAQNDILAFMPYPEPQDNGSKGLAVAAKIGVSNTIPAPTEKYQVLSCTSFTSSTTYTIAFDWVRAHA